MIQQTINNMQITLNDENLLHSFNDEPAVIHQNGQKEWYNNGKRHRENGPAIISVYGEEWFYDGLPHREDGPAVDMKDGHKEWIIHGTLSRGDGPALISRNGSARWYFNGILINEELSYQEDIEPNCIENEVNIPINTEKLNKLVKSYGNEFAKRCEKSHESWYNKDKTVVQILKRWYYKNITMEYKHRLMMPYYAGIKTKEECLKNKKSIITKMLIELIKNPFK